MLLCPLGIAQRWIDRGSVAVNDDTRGASIRWRYQQILRICKTTPPGVLVRLRLWQRFRQGVRE
jgi:ribose 1,5-bisphosphokinase PhnN